MPFLEPLFPKSKNSPCYQIQLLLFILYYLMIKDHLTYLFTPSCLKDFSLCFWNIFHSNFPFISPTASSQSFIFSNLIWPLNGVYQVLFVGSLLYFSSLSLGVIIHSHSLRDNYMLITST